MLYEDYPLRDNYYALILAIVNDSYVTPDVAFSMMEEGRVKKECNK